MPATAGHSKDTCRTADSTDTRIVALFMTTPFMDCDVINVSTIRTTYLEGGGGLQGAV